MPRGIFSSDITAIGNAISWRYLLPLNISMPHKNVNKPSTKAAIKNIKSNEPTSILIIEYTNAENTSIKAP